MLLTLVVTFLVALRERASQVGPMSA